MHIVFLGNCQMHALRDIFRRFIGRVEQVTFEFVNAYEGVIQTSFDLVNKADVVVLQQGQRAAKIDRRHIPDGVSIHLVPAVSGAFLWPFQGTPHPLKPAERYGNPPYPEDYNDQFLAKLILNGTPADQALDIYRKVDVATETHAQRHYVHALRAQKKLDQATGFDCAGIIENYLQDEQLFQAPYHFSGRIARHLSAILSRRLGFPETYARRMENFLADAPFLPRFLPVHPSIARHFGLRWVTEDTRYPYIYEGGYTFDEYVIRFMRGTWSASLQEGVIDAQRGKPEAKSKLIIGLQEAPRSALGHQALSTILSREGDFEAALFHQRRAFELGPEPSIALRLGSLLQRAGDGPGSVDAFEVATRLDPVDPACWAALRDALTAIGREEDAKAANRKFREFSAKLM